MPSESIGEFSILSPSQKKELERKRQEEEARKAAEAAKKAAAALKAKEAARIKAQKREEFERLCKTIGDYEDYFIGWGVSYRSSSDDFIRNFVAGSSVFSKISVLKRVNYLIPLFESLSKKMDELGSYYAHIDHDSLTHDMVKHYLDVLRTAQSSLKTRIALHVIFFIILPLVILIWLIS